MDSSVQKVIDAAKRAVVALDLEVIDLDAILVGLAILRDDEEIKSVVAECAGVKTVWWPEDLVDQAGRCASITADAVRTRKFGLGLLFRKIYNDLRRNGGDPGLPEFLKAVLTSPEAMTSGAVAAFHAGQKAAARMVTPTGMLARLGDFAQRSRKLHSMLARDVIGQEDAIAMLADGYARSIRAPKSSGLRGIFTFMGPPGVGKTMLAERFASALGSVEENPCGTETFSMEMTDDESLLFTLFGVDSAYKTAKTGVLHDRIKENPRQVIVFDEIEKAHPKIIQSLLTLLQKGSFRDSCNQDVVDLSQCFVIFTTNLGQDLFASRNRSGILRGRSFTSDDLFDLLASAKLREHARVEGAPAALSPEFVNRLRKGGAVLFNQLSGSDYLRLLDKCLQQPGTEANPNLPEIRAATPAKRLLILSLLPDLSPRRVQAECEALREKWIADILSAPPAGLQSADPERFTITCELALDVAGEDVHKNLASGQKLRILVVDNDQRMAGFIEKFVLQKYGETNPTVERANDPAGIMEAIARVSPDLLMLDLDLPETALPEGGILAIHRRIAEGAPDLPVILFSESEDWAEKLPEILVQGGARDFFSFKEASTKDINISDDLQERFRALLDNTLFEKVMAAQIRTRRKLELSFRYDYLEESKFVVAGISRLKERQVVSLTDESGGIRPSDIPSVTFDDVFGLERAKERLHDAIRFMKNPGLLLAFGTRPPSGFLLAGPSGTGKTHLARAAANAAGCVFYSLSAGELESKWAGEGEERIRQLFAAARKYAPAVIFIDEIDAIAGDRAGIASGGANHVKMLNQLLVCMDGFAETKGSVLVLAATNRPEALDPAILRPGRFDETIRIEAPDAKAREAMFRKRLQGMPLSDDVLPAIPSLICRSAGMSPAELDRIIREAAYMAAREQRERLSLADLEAACNLVRYGASRRDLIIREQDRRQTAWHEAGHAIARLTLFPESKLDYLSIVPNESGALGFAAWQHDESKHSYSAEDYRHLIMVALAGREAEKLCPGAGPSAINTGVSSDYERATALAWDAVTRFGFDEASGPLSTSGIPEYLHAQMVDTIQPRLDQLLRECLQATSALMKKEERAVGSLASALLQKQALSGEDVQSLRASRSTMG